MREDGRVIYAGLQDGGSFVKGVFSGGVFVFFGDFWDILWPGLTVSFAEKTRPNGENLLI